MSEDMLPTSAGLTTCMETDKENLYHDVGAERVRKEPMRMRACSHPWAVLFM